MSAWRLWFAKTPDQQNFDRLRSRALEAAAFALFPIMDREDLQDLHSIAAGELAQVAVQAFEKTMLAGLRDPSAADIDARGDTAGGSREGR